MNERNGGEGKGGTGRDKGRKEKEGGRVKGVGGEEHYKKRNEYSE